MMAWYATHCDLGYPTLTELTAVLMITREREPFNTASKGRKEKLLFVSLLIVVIKEGEVEGRVVIFSARRGVSAQINRIKVIII